MDQIKATSDNPEPDKHPTTNAPLGLTALNQETAQNAKTAEAESNKAKFGANFEAPPPAAQREPAFFGIWFWIKRDTTSTDWLIVLLTTVIAITSYLQWHEIRSGSIDTHTLAQAADIQARKMADMSTAADKIREAAENMVTQDQRIADNAQNSLEVSSRQSKAVLDDTIKDFQRDQRAWIGFSESNIIKFDDKEPFQLLITFTNSGKSPAVQDETSTIYSIEENPPTGPNPNPTYFFEKTSAIPPGGKYGLRITNAAVPPRYDAISNGKQTLKFFGQFKYHDVYQPDVVHTTSFCIYYDRQSKSMSFCYTGNNMD